MLARFIVPGFLASSLVVPLARAEGESNGVCETRLIYNTFLEYQYDHGATGNALESCRADLHGLRTTAAQKLLQGGASTPDAQANADDAVLRYITEAGGDDAVCSLVWLKSHPPQCSSEAVAARSAPPAKPVLKGDQTCGEQAYPVEFVTEDNSTGWKLLRANGEKVGDIPGTLKVCQGSGYQVSNANGSQKLAFIGSGTDRRSATIMMPYGNKTAAATTFIASAVGVGVAAGLYVAGNTEKCGYGAYKDKDGNTVYTTEQKGSCDSNPPPSGYAAGSGTDLGDTASGNRKAGLVLGGIGIAGMIGGGIWWLASKGSPTVEWGSGETTRRTAGIGFMFSGTSIAARAVW